MLTIVRMFVLCSKWCHSVVFFQNIEISLIWFYFELWFFCFRNLMGNVLSDIFFYVAKRWFWITLVFLINWNESYEKLRSAAKSNDKYLSQNLPTISELPELRLQWKLLFVDFYLLSCGWENAQETFQINLFPHEKNIKKVTIAKINDARNSDLYAAKYLALEFFLSHFYHLTQIIVGI